MIDVRLITRRRDLATLLPDWSRLFAADPRATPRGEPHLVTAFHAMFTPEIRPHVLVATDARGLVRGVLPLGIRRRRVGPIFVRELTSLIAWHGYYTDAVADPACAAEVCGALRNALLDPGWDQIALRHVRQTSWLLDPEIGVLTDLDWLTARQGLPAPTIALPPVHLLNKGSRKDMERRERTLRATGEIRLEWEPPGPGVQAAAADFVRLHTALKTWQRQTCTFRFGTAARDFPGWLEAEVGAGRAGLFTTRCDGTLLAAHVILRGKQQAHSYRVAWAPNAAAFGLGILQTTRVIEACAALGDRSFDLGPGEEPYKLKWHPDCPALIDLSGRRHRWRSQLAGAWLRLRGRGPPASDDPGSTT